MQMLTGEASHEGKFPMRNPLEVTDFFTFLRQRNCEDYTGKMLAPKATVPTQYFISCLLNFDKEKRPDIEEALSIIRGIKLGRLSSLNQRSAKCNLPSLPDQPIQSEEIAEMTEDDANGPIINSDDQSTTADTPIGRIQHNDDSLANRLVAINTNEPNPSPSHSSHGQPQT
jgi:hypothetical protein